MTGAPVGGTRGAPEGCQHDGALLAYRSRDFHVGCASLLRLARAASGDGARGRCLCAAFLAGGVDSLRWRAAVPAAALVLVAAGAGIVMLRHGRQLEPDYGRPQQATRGVRTVLTNTAVVAYYLHDPEPLLDRSVNPGDGLEASTRLPYTVVDDNSFGGAGRGPGRVVARVDDRIVMRVVR
jgi:hypothetical protein